MSHDPSTHDWGVVRSMAGPRRADGPAATERPDAERPAEQVNAFRVGDTYLLRHYFEAPAVFDALEPYYNARRYRFELPADAFADVVGVLSGHGYDVNAVADHAPFTVVVRKYTDHPDAVFEDAVLRVSTDEYNAFVLADADAVSRAVSAGVTRLTETPPRLRLSSSSRPTTVADAVAPSGD